jgi:hypothetical protein
MPEEVCLKLTTIYANLADSLRVVAAAVGAGEEMVFAPECNRADGALDHIGVDRRAPLGAALIERAAFWYQLLVLKSVFWLTVLRLCTFLEKDRFTTRLAL